MTRLAMVLTASCLVAALAVAGPVRAQPYCGKHAGFGISIRFGHGHPGHFGHYAYTYPHPRLYPFGRYRRFGQYAYYGPHYRYYGYGYPGYRLGYEPHYAVPLHPYIRKHRKKHIYYHNGYFGFRYYGY